MWLALLRRFWQPLVALVAAGLIWWGVHKYGAQRYEAGYQQARAEDAAALAEAREREAKANAAAHAHYEVEHAQTFLAAREPVGVSQLCGPSETDPVRPERTAAAGADGTAPTSGLVQPVPAADHGLASDRRRLLGALAAFADEQSAINREWQARNQRRGRDSVP